MIKLDDRDIKILSVLQRDGRITKTELAEKINLSPTPCWERLKRLEKEGVIEGYEARISLTLFKPVSIIFMEIFLESHQTGDFRIFEEAVQEYDEITECWAVGGGVDYLMKVVCSSVDSYQRLVDGMLERQLGIQRYYTYIVTKPVKIAPTPPVSLLMES